MRQLKKCVSSSDAASWGSKRHLGGVVDEVFEAVARWIGVELGP